MTRLMFAVMTSTALWAAVCSGFATASDAILINFSSPYCGHCQAMEPTLGQLERSGVPVRHVNVVSEPAFAKRFGVTKTPTFVVLSGGREVTRLVGAQSLGNLRSALSIDPSANLIPTKSSGPTLAAASSPQTRLAPVATMPETQLTSSQQNEDAPSFALAATPAAHTRRSIRNEPMPSVSLADAVERARAATVRLRVHDGHGYGAGTGTIIDTHGEEALVLTCGHLFRETKGKGKVEVDLFVGGQTRTVLGQVVDYDADTRDIALVVIRPGLSVQPVAVLNSSEKVVDGQSAFSFGCDRGDDPSRRDTRITGINKYNQHLGVSNLEIDGAPIDGRSGGGLFDNQGRLIGVCNAADYKGDIGIYAGPGNVYWQLDRAGLTHLHRESNASQGNSRQTQLAAAAAAPTNRPAAIQPVVESVPQSPTRSTTGVVQAGGQQEVIVIMRDRNDPTAATRVMTLANPSPELIRQLEQAQRR